MTELLAYMTQTGLLDEAELQDPEYTEDELIAIWERRQHQAYVDSLGDPQWAHIGTWDAFS